MGGLRYIDVLRQTRDHGLDLDDSMNARTEKVDVWAITSLERATGDDLLCIISSIALMHDVAAVIIHFRKTTRKKAETYFCFLFDELEFNGFDTTYLTYNDEKVYELCIPLFTDQDEEELVPVEDSYELRR